MRFMRLPILMVLIALASSSAPWFSFLLRFGGLALAALTLLGALSDMNGAIRRMEGMSREEVLSLWYGGKRRERQTWEALAAEVTALAGALRLPMLPAPDSTSSGHRSAIIRLTPGKRSSKGEQASQAEAAAEPPTAPPHPALRPLLRLLAIEAASELIVVGTLLLNWFRPAPGTSDGEQLALLALGLLALGLLWFDWRLMRRFVAAVYREMVRLIA